MTTNGTLVAVCQICNREVAGSNLGWCYFAPRSTQHSVPPGSVNKYQLWLGRQMQVWLIPLADEMQGVQIKLCYPLTMRAIYLSALEMLHVEMLYISTTFTYIFTFTVIMQWPSVPGNDGFWGFCITGGGTTAPLPRGELAPSSVLELLCDLRDELRGLCRDVSTSSSSSICESIQYHITHRQHWSCRVCLHGTWEGWRTEMQRLSKEEMARLHSGELQWPWHVTWQGTSLCQGSMKTEINTESVKVHDGVVAAIKKKKSSTSCHSPTILT